jgi:hypothetical protein
MEAPEENKGVALFYRIRGLQIFGSASRIKREWRIEKGVLIFGLDVQSIYGTPV